MNEDERRAVDVLIEEARDLGARLHVQPVRWEAFAAPSVGGMATTLAEGDSPVEVAKAAVEKLRERPL